MKNLLKKVLSVAAATALLMTSVVSASAAEPDADKEYTITITQPSDDEVNMENLPDNLYAFQILSGTVPDNVTPPTGDYENPGTIGSSLPITDIKWGSGINITLLSDLIEALSDSSHIGHYFADLKKASDDGATNDQLALLFAKAISADGFGTRQNMQYLADILGGFEAEGSYVTTNFLDNTKAIQMTKDESDGVKWTAKVKAGYYLIKSGEEDEAVDSAYSARMLFVASNITQRLKESVPFFHKYVVREDVDDNTVSDDLSETDVAGVGDIVDFQLKGTLPTNYDKYVMYKYTFNDALTKGLDVVDYSTYEEVNTPTVLVKVKGLFKKSDVSSYDYITEDKGVPTYWKWNSDIVVEIPASNYTTKWDSAPHTFTVTFSDLKKIELNVTEPVDKTGTYKLGFLFDAPGLKDHTHDGGIEEEHSSKIMVNYKAKVNEEAVIGSAGNKNTASLTYSNNPQNEDDTGTSTEDTAFVYVFGLDILKYDAGTYIEKNSIDDADKLANAEFAVTRSDGKGGTEIAVFKKIEADDATGDNENGLANKAHYQLQKWVKFIDTEPSSYSLGPDEVINIATFEDPLGKLLISGLDAGVEYTFTETKAPGEDGDYATIEPFTITLTAELNAKDEYTGNLTEAKTDKEVTSALDFEHYVTIRKPTIGNMADGSAEIAVANFKYTDLPSTGGIGVYIYYIAGGCVVALALVLFALSKKKKTTK